MSLHENLRTIRLSKGWSQEEMAATLEYSPNGYAKVERGENFPKIDKLKKMAEVLETDLEKLMSSNGGSLVNINGNCHHSYQSQSVILLSETQCAHELEKAQLLLQERNKEIDLLKTQNHLLQNMIALLENAEKHKEQ
jgi:transcriptional regulator with XRE-family HTH domain